QVEHELMTRLRDPQLPEGQRVDLALVAATLGDLKGTTAADVAQSLAGEFARMDKAAPNEELGAALVAVAGRLEPAAAARTADTLAQALTKTTPPGALVALAQGLSAVAGRLEPAAAARTADTLAQALTNKTMADRMPGHPNKAMGPVVSAVAG